MSVNIGAGAIIGVGVVFALFYWWDDVTDWLEESTGGVGSQRLAEEMASGSASGANLGFIGADAMKNETSVFVERE